MAKSILLIDDDKDDAEIFQEALAEADNTVAFQYIDDGRQAIEKLSQKNIPLPSIIFLDVNMPITSGWDCLRELKKNNALRHIPVIMYSTSSHQREINLATDLGANTFFTKPTSYKDLIEKISQVINNLTV